MDNSTSMTTLSLNGIAVTDIPQGLEDGRIRNLLALTHEDFMIRSIAGRLSRINRYAGAVHHAYSVAAHSVLVSHLLPDHLAWDGLMHDATESFGIGDLISPIKRLLPDFCRIENAIAAQLQGPLCLGVSSNEEWRVNVADERAYHLECLFLRGAFPRPEHTRFPCEPVSGDEEELRFLTIDVHPFRAFEWFMRRAALVAPDSVLKEFGDR